MNLTLQIQPAFTLLSIINIVGIGQAIFFSLLLFRLKGHRNKAHLFLAVFLLSYALIQLGDMLEESKCLLVFPHASQIFAPLVFALGPLIFYYVKALTKKEFRFTSQDLVHLIPFFSLLLLLVPYYTRSSTRKLESIISEYNQTETDLIIPYFAVIHILIYLLLSIKQIQKYSRDSKQYFSFQEKISLTWLSILMTGLVIIWIAFLLNTQYSLSWLNYLEASLFTVFIYVLGFKGINQPDIFKSIDHSYPKEKVENSDDEIHPVKKYGKSRILVDKIEDALLRLRNSMEQDRTYKNNQLTLPQLSQLISVPSHHLSQLLNEHLNVNFYDYVNTYRVEEVKIELLNPGNSHLTILALALEAGFNSKASFNKAFKKHEGISPSEYKAQQLEKTSKTVKKEVLSN